MDRAGQQRSSNLSSSSSHRLANAFIVMFLLVQIALPLRYYRQDEARDDERFAWRMFSSVGRRDCKVAVREQTEDQDRWHRVSLRHQYQGTWRTLLERGRPLVVHKLLRSRCEMNPAVRVAEYQRACKTTAGQKLPPTRLQYNCTTQTYRNVNSDDP